MRSFAAFVLMRAPAVAAPAQTIRGAIIGTYAVGVDLQGFKKYLRSGIVIEVAQTTRLDIPLPVGTVSEQVQVTGQTPLVRSSSTCSIGARFANPGNIFGTASFEQISATRLT